jgi:hypothetical protein
MRSFAIARQAGPDGGVMFRFENDDGSIEVFEIPLRSSLSILSDLAEAVANAGHAERGERVIETFVDDDGVTESEKH